jgi:hypothetical protein
MYAYKDVTLALKMELSAYSARHGDAVKSGARFWYNARKSPRSPK